MSSQWPCLCGDGDRDEDRDKIDLQLVIVTFSAVIRLFTQITYFLKWKKPKSQQFLSVCRANNNNNNNTNPQQPLPSENHLIFDGLEALLKPAAPPRFSVIKKVALDEAFRYIYRTIAIFCHVTFRKIPSATRLKSDTDSYLSWLTAVSGANANFSLTNTRCEIKRELISN